MSIFSAFRESSSPAVAMEIAANRVSAASLEWRSGRPFVAAHATEVLQPGAIVASLTGTNVHDRASVSAAVNGVLERLGRPRRIGLVVPDPVAKVSLVRFEQVPARVQDLDQLVRWQVRKTAPFPIDEAQVTYVPGLRADDGQEFVVSLARRDVVAEYETICAQAGAQAGIVDLSTFNVINAVLAGSGAGAGASVSTGADWLLVNIAPNYASIAILRGPHLMFFRNRVDEGEGTLADLVHQTAMYYEDRLKGGGFARVILAGAASAGAAHAADVEELRRSLEARLTTAVETVDPRHAITLTDSISAAPAFLDALSPLVGLLLRDREQAA